VETSVRWFLRPILLPYASALLTATAHSAHQHNSPPTALLIAAGGQTQATVVVSPEAGVWERRAAQDLVKYIALMSGAKASLKEDSTALSRSNAQQDPVLWIGEAAIKAAPELQAQLQRVAKPNPLLRADAIVLKRKGRNIYLAGTNDDSHYYAVAELLRRWGCRWFMPGEFGESIPKVVSLHVRTLDFAYAPPFEVRRYWLSWLGDDAGKQEFMHRNFFNDISVPAGHALGQYTRDLVPPGKTDRNVPISDESTAEHVARQVLPGFAAGKDVSLSMEDGIYDSDSAHDKALTALQYDKYMLSPSYTDAFLSLYNNVASRLLAAAPQSKAKLGFLMYSNMTLPPVQQTSVAEPLVGYLAPIDIDPNHAMDDPRPGPRREYREMLHSWAKLMPGRVVIYDYDQSMLVWRDLPNPSHQVFRHDVKTYREAGVLGIDTESRGALSTTFTNLYLRGQLMWNPDADADALLADFYPRFYGPAAAPMMASYWDEIFKAWKDTIVTEHEYFIAPAIYTPQLINRLRGYLEAAEAAVKADAQKPSTRAAQHKVGKSLIAVHSSSVQERMRFTRLGFDVLSNYMTMVHAAATDIDYAQAVAAGEQGLKAREELTAMNPTFTAYKAMGENGAAWWPGEVQQYRDLLALTDGPSGKLVAKLPLVWEFRRDPDNSARSPAPVTQRPEDMAKEMPVDLRTDLYLQAQGVVTFGLEGYNGWGWYRTQVDLLAENASKPLRIHFPGLFNVGILYVNGQAVDVRRLESARWWANDYQFNWDVDIAKYVKSGTNQIALKIHNPHHLGGMFRRPFIYSVLPE
jgi:hypothetical protein